MKQKKQYYPQLGEVVLVVSDSQNKHEWHHGLVCEHLRGKDGVVRGVWMIVRDRIWERPIQLVCPCEMRSTMTPECKIVLGIQRKTLPLKIY